MLDTRFCAGRGREEIEGEWIALEFQSFSCRVGRGEWFRGVVGGGGVGMVSREILLCYWRVQVYHVKFRSMKRCFLPLIFSVMVALPAVADFAALVEKGDAHDKRYQTSQALTFYLPAEKLNPDNPELLVKIARQYAFRMSELTTKEEKIQSGRTALKYAERAVSLAPDRCDPHLSIAICWGKLTPLLGNREKVAASRKIKVSAEQAVKLDPGNDYAWHLLGRWHQALANMGGTTRALAKLIYGELPAASNEQAIACFKKAMAINPKRLVHVVELGRTYAMLGQVEQAKKLIQQGLTMPNLEKDDPETKLRGKATLKDLS